jgi:hypothetical protein
MDLKYNAPGTAARRFFERSRRNGKSAKKLAILFFFNYNFTVRDR